MRGSRRGEWKYKGKGRTWCSHYMWDENGERSMWLTAVIKGKLQHKPAESWQMLLKAGWVKVK